jgi:type I restriction enzyme, S subunit
VQYDFPLSAAQAAALGKPKLAGQPYRTSGGKMLFNPTLNREIPEGWEVKPVEAILAKENPSKKIPASEILENGNVPVIDQSKEFICGFTNDEDARIRDNPKIIFGDHTRILKFINFDFARGADGTQMIASNSLSMPPHLFYHSLLKIDLSSYGYARHFKFLKQSNITLPDSNLAQRFEVIVAAHYELIRENTFQNQELTALRDWLLPMLMNGQVRVTG